MARTSTGMVLAIAIAFATLDAVAQTLVPPPTPESHVLEAKRLLGDIAASPTTDVGKQIAALQIHFTDFATAFLTGRPAVKGRDEAVGTSGAVAVDWRPKYAQVERDLRSLIGSPDPNDPDRGIVSLDPVVRKQLESVRTNLRLFYAGALRPR
ncbi:MAG TPA: hypothetical protein VKH42_12235 [Vicinamibacterales bacterium]|nr:hypothetical protein [Vicinamibacterales bacterium]